MTTVYSIGVDGIEVTFFFEQARLGNAARVQL